MRDCFFLPDGTLAVFCKNSRCLQFSRRNPSDGALTIIREIPFDESFGEPVHGVLLN